MKQHKIASCHNRKFHQAIMELSSSIIKPVNQSLYWPTLQPGLTKLMKSYTASDENFQFHNNIFKL